MNPAAIAFWSLFTIWGTWMQSVIPGVDFLAPGFILAMLAGETGE